MSEVRGRFWLCAACGKHVPARLAQCRCGSSMPARPDIGLDPAGSARTSDAGDPTWFAVGPAKLMVMSVVTLGLYQIYWFYKQWRRVRDSGEDIWPIPRSLFGVIFGYSLFRRVLGSAGGAAVLALIYAALCIASNLPLPYGLVALLSVVPLALVQRVASAEAARDFPHDDPNRRLKGANWLAVTAGVGMLGLITYGLAGREKPTSLEFLAKVAAEANQAPRTESNGVALDKVDALPAMLVYHYTVTDVARQQLQERGSQLKALTTVRLCQQPLVRQGVSIRFVYRDVGQQEVAAVDVSPRDCGL